MLTENDMSRLLAAQDKPVVHHVFIYIFVAYRGLLILHTNLVAGFVKPQVRHHRGNDRIACQPSLFHQVFAAHIKHQVTVHNLTILIDSDTSPS